MKVMSESIFEKIIRKTGRKPIGCKCQECKKQCLRTPCLGTPDDILSLIDAGFIDKLALTEWATGLFLGRVNYTIRMIQAQKLEKGCIFFENGLCQLHDLGLKPTEGKLSHHTIKLDNYQFNKSISWQVAKTWIDEQNVEKVLNVFARFNEAQSFILKIPDL